MIGSSSPGRGWEFFYSPPRLDRLCGPPSLISNGYQGRLLQKEKDKRFGNAEHVTLGTWNIRGLTHKLDELQEKLESRKIGIAIITETKKKKLQGTCDLSKYTMLYGAVQSEREDSISRNCDTGK
jgi:hypothetical protein